jgi:hypothetical protein
VTRFELDWLGGPAERHFRRCRPGIDALPWGTLDARAYPAELVDLARLSWTEGAWREYTTAAAFADLLGALLAAGAPVDLVGMAGDFIADEMVHAELNARMAMELGGAAPYDVDHGTLRPRALDRPPLERACELALTVSCIGETLSVPLLAGPMQAAAHPLTRAVLERIVIDEAPHARLGWLVFEWAGDRLDDRERARLGRVALEALAGYRDYWRPRGPPRFPAAQLHELGWLEPAATAEIARSAVRDRVAAPLAALGIDIPAPALDDLLAG